LAHKQNSYILSNLIPTMITYKGNWQLLTTDYMIGYPSSDG